MFGLTFTSPQMMMQHWTASPLSLELKSVIPRYQNALAAARHAVRSAQPSGRNYINYWIGRLQFGIQYLNAIEAVRAFSNSYRGFVGGGVIRSGDGSSGTGH